MIPHFAAYDKIIVAFSGGKDSMACVLRLLDLGVDPSDMELWHHDVDGREGSHLMDWPVTRTYCILAADHLKIPLYFSWRVGGFEREMLRDASATAPVSFETPSGKVITVGGDGPTHNKAGEPYVRRRFPQQSPDLSVRWCSAVLKIDVAARVFTNDPRFARGTRGQPQRFLFVTGERREEGKPAKDGKPATGRAAYKEFEPHRANSQARQVDQWRAVIDYTEAEVWDAMKKYGIVPHPAYRLGFSRVSCSSCIFGNDDQWASIKQMFPEQLERIARFEEEFTATIDRSKRRLNVRERAELGTPLDPDPDLGLVQIARGKRDGALTVSVDPKQWKLPSGAFKETGGPT